MENIARLEEYMQKLLSKLIEEHGWSDRKDEINEWVHDSLAVENYPTYTLWSQEYPNGYEVFLNMQQSRIKLKRLVGQEYERFIYSHRDL